MGSGTKSVERKLVSIEPEPETISVLMLLLGVTLATVSLFSLRKLMSEVRKGLGFDFDRQFMTYLRRRSSPRLTAVVQGITYSASTVAISVMSVILSVAWWRGGQRGDAVLVMVTVLSSSSLGLAGKLFFSRPRPQFFPWLTGAGGWSFPSGHTLAAVTLGGLVAGLESRAQGIWQRVVLWVGAGFWSSMVGVSRIYLGVHYPSDVLASLAVGSLHLLVTFSVHWWLTGRWPRRAIVADRSYNLMPD